MYSSINPLLTLMTLAANNIIISKKIVVLEKIVDTKEELINTNSRVLTARTSNARSSSLNILDIECEVKDKNESRI